jgi:hypothetical protein
MKRYATIAAAIIFVAIIFAAIVPMWMVTANVSLPPAALAAIVFMIIGCFAVGGGLMFLIFYSARKGYDDRAHQDQRWRNTDPG